ncbi:hypothetical protein [Paraburkholderia sp. BL17N1]|uniref:hypothetical protein n=1 Tax=Paraburkholderia sp. BL17N1 TaxID=1938798 RepID=UPI0011C431AA|nr:hypothetical protein [Paraburkholderia sp. BL17N1]
MNLAVASALCSLSMGVSLGKFLISKQKSPPPHLSFTKFAVVSSFAEEKNPDSFCQSCRVISQFGMLLLRSDDVGHKVSYIEKTQSKAFLILERRPDKRERFGICRRSSIPRISNQLALQSFSSWLCPPATERLSQNFTDASPRGKHERVNNFFQFSSGFSNE